MASAEEYERQLYLRYGKVQWENMKRNYLRENIRQGKYLLLSSQSQSPFGVQHACVFTYNGTACHAFYYTSSIFTVFYALV